MFWLIKQVSIALLSFSELLACKCVPLNDTPCINRLTLIDLNPIELYYYPFMIILYKCNCCSVVDDLITKICSQWNERRKY